MADSFIQLPADSTGKQLDTALVNMGVGTTAVHREKMVVADPTSTSGFATVSSSQGLQVYTTGIVTVLTASSGITPLVNIAGTSSAIAPATSSGGLLVSPSMTNWPIVSVSSGLVQISGTPTILSTSGTNPWSSAPGFNLPVVTVSSGLVQISGTPTVTATAGTNPWSSAPGFNVPTVSVSSGLVQIAGTAAVLSASSGFVRAFPVGAVTSSGLTAFHAMSTGGAVATNITTAPSAFYGYSIFNSSVTIQAVKFYNSTAPTVGGSTANLLLTVIAPGSTGGGGANLALPIGLYSSNGWSLIISAGMNDTDTGAPGTNTVSVGMFYQT